MLLVYSIFYGVHLTTFGLSMHSLLRKRDADGIGRAKWVSIITSFLIFGLLAVQMAFNMRLALQSFTLYNGPGGARMGLQAGLWTSFGLVQVCAT